MKKNKMMRLLFLVVALTVLVASGLLCGCEKEDIAAGSGQPVAGSAEQDGQPGQQAQALPSKPSQQLGTEEGLAVKVDYEIVSYDAIPDNIKALVDEHKKEPLVTIVDANNSKYVFIAIGARPTGGYSVVIKSVTECNGIVTVVYGEQKPEKGAMVTQAFTYPWIIIKIDTTLPVKVVAE
jgi:hypothetical protein